jgi:hypothetical protein
MISENKYFFHHLAENLKLNTSQLASLASDIALAGDISQDDAIVLLAKPTNIQSARSLVKLCNSLPDSIFDFADMGVSRE